MSNCLAECVENEPIHGVGIFAGSAHDPISYRHGGGCLLLGQAASYKARGSCRRRCRTSPLGAVSVAQVIEHASPTRAEARRHIEQLDEFQSRHAAWEGLVGVKACRRGPADERHDRQTRSASGLLGIAGVAQESTQEPPRLWSSGVPKIDPLMALSRSARLGLGPDGLPCWHRPAAAGRTDLHR